MKRILSIRDVTEVMFELPAGVEPYEEFDFDAHFEDAKSEEELRNSWRVYTRVKDALNNGRRMENASWRLWFRERLRSSPSASDLLLLPTHKKSNIPQTHLPLPWPSSHSFSSSSSSSAASSTFPSPSLHHLHHPHHHSHQLSTHHRIHTDDVHDDHADETVPPSNIHHINHHNHSINSDDPFRDMREKFERESDMVESRAKAETIRALLTWTAHHDLPPVVVDDLLTWVHSFLLSSATGLLHLHHNQPSSSLLPPSFVEAQDALLHSPVRPRPRAAVFCHSLERNGANNFLFHLLRELRNELAFDLFSPKDGPMRPDYEALAMGVNILDARRPSYSTDVRRLVRKYDYTIANTIMTTEVIHASKMLGIPCLWVIHEAWPKDQFDYYAKEVFMMSHLDSEAIVEAFQCASKIVFPATVQQKCYAGLFDPKNARVIYNGIPLAGINSYLASQNRQEVRKALGYAPHDLVLVHMGTVCKRKGQLITCTAFQRLLKEYGTVNGTSFKLLMVGARYIRQHEIDYIEACKANLNESVGREHAQILDVKKDVLPYYMAADILLCPSLNEVLPLVICEAMAFEIPVIASKIDGIPESLTDGVEGVLISPNSPEELYNAICQLADDPVKRAKMGAAGRNRVLKQFSFEYMSEAYRSTIRADLVETL